MKIIFFYNSDIYIFQDIQHSAVVVDLDFLAQLIHYEMLLETEWDFV